MNVTVAAMSIITVNRGHSLQMQGRLLALPREGIITIYFRSGRLTRNNAIPEQEVHLKPGGDAGGGSFKMAFQIANLKTSKVKTSTVVFAMFHAKDTWTTLKIQGASEHPKGSYLEVGTYTVNVLQIFYKPYRLKPPH